jgi:WD40 repeat protein
MQVNKRLYSECQIDDFSDPSLKKQKDDEAINKLSNDALAHIFNYLPDEKHLELSLVNRRWCAVSTGRVWKKAVEKLKFSWRYGYKKDELVDYKFYFGKLKHLHRQAANRCCRDAQSDSIQRIFTIHIKNSLASKMSFSHRNDRLAFTQKNYVCILNLNRKGFARLPDFENLSICSIAYSDNDQFLACGCLSGKLCVYKLNQEAEEADVVEVKYVLNLIEEFGEDGPEENHVRNHDDSWYDVRSISFSPDNNSLLITSSHGQLYMWSWQEKKCESIGNLVNLVPDFDVEVDFDNCSTRYIDKDRVLVSLTQATCVFKIAKDDTDRFVFENIDHWPHKFDISTSTACFSNRNGKFTIAVGSNEGIVIRDLARSKMAMLPLEADHDQAVVFIPSTDENTHELISSNGEGEVHHWKLNYSAERIDFSRRRLFGSDLGDMENNFGLAASDDGSMFAMCCQNKIQIADFCSKATQDNSATLDDQYLPIALAIDDKVVIQYPTTVDSNDFADAVVAAIPAAVAAAVQAATSDITVNAITGAIVNIIADPIVGALEASKTYIVLTTASVAAEIIAKEVVTTVAGDIVDLDMVVAAAIAAIPAAVAAAEAVTETAVGVTVDLEEELFLDCDPDIVNGYVEFTDLEVTEDVVTMEDDAESDLEV